MYTELTLDNNNNNHNNNINNNTLQQQKSVCMFILTGNLSQLDPAGLIASPQNTHSALLVGHTEAEVC